MTSLDTDGSQEEREREPSEVPPTVREEPKKQPGSKPDIQRVAPFRKCRPTTPATRKEGGDEVSGGVVSALLCEEICLFRVGF